MGVCDSSYIYLENKLTNKENKNNLYNLITSKHLPLNEKKNIKGPINTSKSIKDKKNNFYSITEINKNYKIPTKKSSPKNNISSNYSFEKNQILSKKSNSRNISFLKEDIKSKKKLNKKIPIYAKDSNNKKKIQENNSFSKNPREKKQLTEWTNKKKKFNNNDNNYTSKKSISPNKRINDHLFNNWSFNDLSFNNNISSFNLNNKSGIKSINNSNIIINQKNNKKLYFNKNILSQINKYNNKNINNIKKLNHNTGYYLNNYFNNNVNKEKNFSISNYKSYNNNNLGMKKKIFSLNNNHSFYDKYSLYIIDDVNPNNNNNNNANYNKNSDVKDFINILNQKTYNESKIIKDLLELEERNWYYELIEISSIISKTRNNLDRFFNLIIEKYILFYEHFNWIIYSLSIYFKNIFYENENNKNNEINFNNINYISGLEIKVENWLNGFKWKGLYIKVIPYEKSKTLINEIKALNYFFFDYLQIINKEQCNKMSDINNKIILSNNIVFPLIGYSKINNLILYVSALIIPKKTNKNKNSQKVSTYMAINELIEQSNKILNYYSSVSDYSSSSINSFETNVSYSEITNNILNINKNKKLKISLLQNSKNIFNELNDLDLESSLGNNFYITDLLQSQLFKQINNYNLIKINHGKYIIFNLSRYIPKLFEIKFKHSQKYNFYSEFNKEKKFFTLNHNHSLNKSIHKLKNKYIKTPEDVLDQIYNMKNTFSCPLNYRDIFINNIYFRILYEKTEKSKKDYKTKTFVDYLFQKSNVNDTIYNIITNKNNNFNKSILNFNNHWNEERYYIKGKYTILYDLIEPIKLDYSIIKNHKNKNNSIHNLFYLKSHYLSLFYSWCEILNKNNFNIKNYVDLKYFMKKYSINTNLLFFALVYIKNEDISDIIKIHLLIKAIYQIFINEDINIKNKVKLNIILYIKNILYPHELTFGNERKEFNYFYSKILFYGTVLFLKYKLVDDYMGLGLLNINIDKNIKNNINSNNNTKINELIPSCESPKEFIKHIILIARKKPFLFLSELEQKLNIIINPYIKFKSSLSLESMKGEIKKKYIKFNNIMTFSFINPLEISGFILAKLLNYYELNENKYINNNNNNNSLNESNDETNISENKNNLEIRHNFRSKKMPKDSIKKEKKNNVNDINNEKIYININNNIYIKEGNIEEFNKDNTKIIPKIQIIKDKLEFKKNIMKSPQKEKNENENELNILSWNDIYNKINITLPPICYKLIFNYEVDYNNIINNNKNGISHFLKYNYNITNPKILEDWKECNLNFFQKIRSCNGNVESALLKSYIYLFVYHYYIKKNTDDAKKINLEIQSIFKNGYYKLSLNELALINLFQGLCCGNYIDSEEYFSKCLMLFLMNYGDPRGRNNDSHGIIQLPLWFICRKILKLKESILYENFKEMYQALDYFELKRNFSINHYKINNINKNNNFSYMNNAQNNIDNILFLYNEKKNNYNSNNNRTNNSFNSNKFINYNSKKLLYDLDKNRSFIFANTPPLIEEDLTLNLSIFNNNYLGKIKTNIYNFPSINSKSQYVVNEFFKENFIIYFFKQIQSLFMNRRLVFSNDYINENISNEIFNTENYIQELDFSVSNDLNSVDTKSKLEEISTNSLKYNININSIEVKNKDNKNNIQNNINSKNNNNKISEINNIKNNINKKKNKKLFSNFLNIDLLEKLSYKKNIPSGVIISFGNNVHNETSHDKYEILALPRVIFKLKNTIISHIYSGWEHNIVLSNKGEIFSFGYNQSYQCGLPNSNLLCKNSINDPTNISTIYNLYAKSISCGNEHSLILSKNNEVYGIGNNEDGVLGINDIKLKSYKPILINFGEKGEYTKKIKQISCGTIHNLALTEDGKIFSWGAGMGGQLGHDEKLLKKYSGGNKYYLYKPTIISSLIDMKVNVNKISCGEAHSIALSNNGNVYSWGFGSNGQLGLGFCEDSFEPGKGLPKSRKFLPEKININGIKNIQCGKTFTMLINNENKLFGCGNNDLNQLGFNNEKNYNKKKCHDLIFPTLIDSFSTFQVKKIACGEGHCLAIINDISFSGIQSLWSWGNNKFGQLGQYPIIKNGLPKPIYLLMDYSNYKCGFEEISCGGFHSLCLIKYKESINWIDDDFEKKISKTIDEIEI